MKFKLTTSSHRYDSNSVEKLKTLGFTFQNRLMYLGEELVQERVEDEIEITFETLEQLIAFSDVWGELIVCGNRIEIYDDYRE